MTLPSGVTKLPRGVELNGKNLRISFMYRGERCREPVLASKLTKATIAYADNKRRAILAEIKEGRFEYTAHFPESPRAASFSSGVSVGVNRTVKEGIKRWLEVQNAKKASSTALNYRSKSKHVVARFGNYRIVDVSKSDLELFQAHLLKDGLSPKTVNDVFTIVRGVWADAFSDGIIKTDPLDRITNLARDDDIETADPFSREEIHQIAVADKNRTDDVRMIHFNCWAGLSLSEVIALAVEDIELEAGVVNVRRALVVGEYKVPKERSRIRRVELVDPALSLIREALNVAQDHPQLELMVTQRDNITKRVEKMRLVFMNSTNGKAWNSKSVSTWFTAHLRKAGVRHRGANQCRHTFASQALSSYVPVEWVARQLGHMDTTMVKKHYGRWIPNDTKSMAGLVSQMMGFREAQSGPERHG